MHGAYVALDLVFCDRWHGSALPSLNKALKWVYVELRPLAEFTRILGPWLKEK
jgi:hypothetical protein